MYNLRILEGWEEMRRMNNPRIWEGWEEMRRMDNLKNLNGLDRDGKDLISRTLCRLEERAKKCIL